MKPGNLSSARSLAGSSLYPYFSPACALHISPRGPPESRDTRRYACEACCSALVSKPRTLDTFRVLPHRLYVSRRVLKRGPLIPQVRWFFLEPTLRLEYSRSDLSSSLNTISHSLVYDDSPFNRHGHSGYAMVSGILLSTAQRRALNKQTSFCDANSS